MSHEVEKMAYTNAVPWHGLGKYKADPNVSLENWMKDSGTDFDVVKGRLNATFVHNKKKKTLAVGDQRQALIRVPWDDKREPDVLTTVGSGFIPVQNRAAFEFFEEYLNAGDATMETMGSLKGGRLVWGLAKLKKDFNAGTTANPDMITGHLLVASPHKSGESLIIKTCAERVVCANTMAIALREAKKVFRFVHKAKFDKTTIANAKTALGIAREQMDEFAENVKLLRKLNLDRDEVLKILAPVYDKDLGKQAKPGKPENATIEKLMDDFNKWATQPLIEVMRAYDGKDDFGNMAPGAQPGNAWGVFNAVTYYSDHIAARSQDQRLFSAWIGDASKKKTRVLNTLLDLSAGKEKVKVAA